LVDELGNVVVQRAVGCCKSILSHDHTDEMSFLGKVKPFFLGSDLGPTRRILLGSSNSRVYHMGVLGPYRTYITLWNLVSESIKLTPPKGKNTKDTRHTFYKYYTYIRLIRVISDMFEFFKV
jgi:hypothetical protein